MDVQSNALTTAASDQTSRRTPIFAAPLAILGFIVAALLLLWVIAIATPLVAFLMAVAVAVAWCLWLEKHPERPTGKERDRSNPIASEHRIS